MIHNAKNTWETIIGLEIHAQIISQSKLFSTAPVSFNADPNTKVNFFDIAMPGTLPVLNKQCVTQIIKTGLAMNCVINSYSVFSRKNYFYPDLPAGYQISQFNLPIVGEGFIEIELPHHTKKRIGIERIHLEQDAGKLIHDQDSTCSLIDLNRAGIGLMEIVSKPDIRNAEEAIEYIKTIRNILRYIGSCDGNLQEGSLRVDVNISVHRPNKPMGTRCELKNINSFKFIKQAINFEEKRQIELIEKGEQVRQETRLFDSRQGVTRAMRSKEDAHDYRYFPDPDLPPLIIHQSEIHAIRQKLPELPYQKYTRFLEKYSLTQYDAALLISEKEYATYFEEVLIHPVNPKLTANWIISELLARINKHNQTIEKAPPPNHFAALMLSLQDKKISGKIGKEVLDIMFQTKQDPNTIIEKHGLHQMVDSSVLNDLIEQLITDNIDQVKKFHQGKTNIFGWFVGQIMKKTNGKANPQLVNDLLNKKIKNNQ